MQQPARIFQRGEFTLPRRNLHFLLAQFRLRLLQARLQLRLLALQRALAAAQLGNLLLQLRQRDLQFGDLVFAAGGSMTRARPFPCPFK